MRDAWKFALRAAAIKCYRGGVETCSPFRENADPACGTQGELCVDHGDYATAVARAGSAFSRNNEHVSERPHKASRRPL